MNLTAQPAWHQLQRLAESIQSSSIQAIGSNQLRLDSVGLNFDFQRQLISQEVIQSLVNLATDCKLSEKIQALFSGAAVNFTENRPALHTALRNRGNNSIHVKQHDIVPDIMAELEKTQRISEAIRSKQWFGYTGKAITDVVNIGIGGSDLGPKTIVEALKKDLSNTFNTHFLSNLDSTEFNELSYHLDPETTLFIVTSKSFTTFETIENAKLAREWVGDAWSKQFIAVTARPTQAIEFGIDEKNILKFWDWIGGRYSLWSAVGLPIAIAHGMDQFNDLLEGAYLLDQHFLNAPFEQNIPVMMALLGIWAINFLDAQTHAVLPYSYRLRYLPQHIQQLDMESNGKSVIQNNVPVEYKTGPIVWGTHAINGQHSFFQLFHQGTHTVPMDFLFFNDIDAHVKANMLGQYDTLTYGLRDRIDGNEVENHGGHPINLISLDHTAKSIGALIAAYEHKIITQAFIWDINPFDQLGVELAKKQIRKLYPTN